jgi:hypothetical protein
VADFFSPILGSLLKDEVLSCSMDLGSVGGKHCYLAGANLGDPADADSRLKPIGVGYSYPVTDDEFSWSVGGRLGCSSRVVVVLFTGQR